MYVSGAQPKHGFNPILYYGGNGNLDEFSDSDDEYEEDEPQEVKILINKNTMAKKNLNQHQGVDAGIILAQHQNIHSEDVVDPADHALKTCSTGGMPIARAAPKKTVSFARRIASWGKVRPDEEVVDPALLVSPEL